MSCSPDSAQKSVRKQQAYHEMEEAQQHIQFVVQILHRIPSDNGRYTIRWKTAVHMNPDFAQKSINQWQAYHKMEDSIT